MYSRSFAREVSGAQAEKKQARGSNEGAEEKVHIYLEGHTTKRIREQTTRPTQEKVSEAFVSRAFQRLTTKLEIGSITEEQRKQFKRKKGRVTE